MKSKTSCIYLSSTSSLTTVLTQSTSLASLTTKTSSLVYLESTRDSSNLRICLQNSKHQTSFNFEYKPFKYSNKGSCGFGFLGSKDYKSVDNNRRFAQHLRSILMRERNNR